MSLIAIVRSEWSGTSGGPGLTQLAVMGAAGGDWNPSGAQTAVNAVRTFWNALAAELPDEVRIQVSPVVDTYDRVTGVLHSSSTAATVPGVVAGTNTLGYAGGAGLKVTWNTNQIRDGRRVRGSTFIVPISSGAFTAVGTIGATPAGKVNTAAAQLISSLNAGGTPLAVWSRPREGLKARAGFATEVIQGTCSTKTAILRGRRD